MRRGGRTGGGGEADPPEEPGEGRIMQNGGVYPKYRTPMDVPRYDADPLQRKFNRRQLRAEEGLTAELNRESDYLMLRDYERARQEAIDQGVEQEFYDTMRKITGMDELPGASDVDVLMSMLSRGTEERGGETLDRKALERKGLRRRLVKQAAPIAGMAGLGLLGAGKAAQSQAQRLGVNLPFGEALLVALGLRK